MLPVVGAVLLSACSIWPAGEDAKGKELCASARPVLAALAAYQRDRGEYPLSLHELVPKYLSRVPFDPGLRFNRESGILDFVYSPPWPQAGEVVCAASANQQEWSCQGAR